MPGSARSAVPKLFRLAAPLAGGAVLAAVAGREATPQPAPAEPLPLQVPATAEVAA